MSRRITKGDFVGRLSEKACLTKGVTKDVVEAYHETIIEILKEGGEIAFDGFGVYSTTSVAERAGYNPATKEKITIQSHKKPTFKYMPSVKKEIKNL